jgi:hypothetical protein
MFIVIWGENEKYFVDLKLCLSWYLFNLQFTELPFAENDPKVYD